MSLLRFGISIPIELSAKFDKLINKKNYSNRSEAIRDLIRRFLIEDEIMNNGEVIGVVVMNVENSDAVAREVLGIILERIQEQGEKNAQKILDDFLLYELPLYINRANSPTPEREKEKNQLTMPSLEITN